MKPSLRPSEEGASNDRERHRRAAIVIDDVLPPWQPRGIEIRGHAEAVPGPPAMIRIYPTRIISWGLDGGRYARNVARADHPAG